MDTNTKQIIDGLFERLAQAEKQNSNRDREAESLIEKHVVAHPAAPYYMAQTMVMQEATIKQLHAQVEQLKTELNQAQAQAQPKSSGGFLSGLFGGHKNQSNQQWQNNPQGNRFNGANGFGPNNGSNNYGPNNGYGNPGSGNSGFGNNGYAQNGYGNGGYGRGNSFLGGALQTAAGVAGGVVLGNMMMNMFSHHQPEEIVNIINEDPMQQNMDGMGSSFMDSSYMDNQFSDASGFTEGFGTGGFDTSTFDNGGFANTDTGTDPFSNGFGSDSYDDPFSGGFGGWFDDSGFDDFGDLS